ncbi:MAG: CrcB family protein [Cyanobacteriota bacterium]|nr:CrcB family protein [Cyanobacteriota bacterium]
MSGASEPGDALLVALGAVGGAWLRFRMVDHLEPALPRRHWGTFSVNVVACLALGLIMGVQQSCANPSPQLLLLLATGFLGSFSTLSTLCGELRAELVQRRWRGAALLAVASVAGGVLALVVGLAIAQGS